jgi:hypothetical protein
MLISLLKFSFMTIILSGAGGSNNWLPLILPFVAIVVIMKIGEIAVKYVRRKRLEYENRTIRSLQDTIDAGEDHAS